MLRLYHYDRSTAAQRVRLLIEEKGLEWESIIVDTARGDVDQLPENYHQMNPKGLVPVVEMNGRGIAESTIILEYLEDAFPETSFRPAAPEDRAEMRQWNYRIGDVVHVAYGYGLFTGGLGAHYGAERLGCTVVPVSGGMTERQVTLIEAISAPSQQRS